MSMKKEETKVRRTYLQSFIVRMLFRVNALGSWLGGGGRFPEFDELRGNTRIEGSKPVVAFLLFEPREPGFEERSLFGSAPRRAAHGTR